MKLVIQLCKCGRFCFIKEKGTRTEFYRNADQLEQIKATNDVTVQNVECPDCNEFNEVRILADSIH